MIILPLELSALIRERDYDGIKALIISKLPYVAAALIIIVAGFIISNIIGKLVVKGLEKKGIDSSTHSFIRSIIVFALRVIFILTAMSTVGLNINSFIAAIAAGGLTAGLGLQQSVSQFASGVQILINRPFKSGDFVEVGTTSGIVKEIKIMYTVLITLDNKRVIIPNSTITASNLTNFTAEPVRRIDLVYSVSYTEDIEKAKNVLGEVTLGNDHILRHPEPVIAVLEHGSSSINLACQVWCEPKYYWEVFYYMQEAVKLGFDKNGITIPFSQLDVHISNNE